MFLGVSKKKSNRKMEMILKEILLVYSRLIISIILASTIYWKKKMPKALYAINNDKSEKNKTQNCRQFWIEGSKKFLINIYKKIINNILFWFGKCKQAENKL